MLNITFAKAESINLPNSQQVSAHPTPPSSTIQFLTMMMKHDYVGGTTHNLARMTQHKVQHTITTLMGNIHLG